MSEFTTASVLEVMRSQATPMLTTVAQDGRLHSHPMTIQQVEDDATTWFFIGLGSEQAEALEGGSQANLAFAKTGEWLSVAGSARLVEERVKVDELWNEETAAWFEGGKDDPRLGLLCFDATSAQGWGAGGSKLGALVEFVKAKVTGSRPSGQSGTTDL
ncbi:pyridoxamine 5'-phosphate oxidase family protein [Galactobacter valiniphilus]|uniref:pyridoxamine 5'-phosphate oxidase family protein n=1 Tax=Galactobacter valiniphilus TaxID=2676122 RepID=UPI0037369ACA